MYRFFRNSYLPFTLTEWNNLDKGVRHSGSFSIFKEIILKFIQPPRDNIFHCHDPKGSQVNHKTKVRFKSSP